MKVGVAGEMVVVGCHITPAFFSLCGLSATPHAD